MSEEDFKSRYMSEFPPSENGPACLECGPDFAVLTGYDPKGFAEGQCLRCRCRTYSDPEKIRLARKIDEVSKR